MRYRCVVISWSGHGEDQILGRILKNSPAGTYLDIGAAHPKFGSVTFLLYEKGWMGIAIEPRKELVKLWEKLRPRDILIQAALTVDGRRGFITKQGFRSHFVEAIDAKLENEYAEVNAISTSELLLLMKEKLQTRPIFIKVDIEGNEHAIVESLLLNDFLPEFWIIEVIDQFGSEHIRRESSEKIAKILEASGYSMVLFDGVNEWYILKSSEFLNLNVWAPAYPGVEKFIPFHLTANYRIRDFVHSKRKTVQAFFLKIKANMFRRK